MKLSWFVALIVAACATFAQAAELTLFDIPLRTSSREEIRNAIKAAGGIPKTSSRDTDKYDATKIGLPGAVELEVVFLDEKLVMAQYNLRLDQKTEERLRKMLVTKYGQPPGQSQFDGQYVGNGKYRWNFDNNMSLVFTSEFFGGRFLTYVNKTEEARLGQLVKESDKRAAQKEAAAKKNVF